MTACRSNYQPYPIYTTVLTGKNLPPHLGYRPKIPDVFLSMLETESKQRTEMKTLKQKLIQTMFRESETQTDPYSPEVTEVTNKGLEILALGWLSWNNGLPAGMNEVLTIERARQKRAWEASLPLPADEESKRIRSLIIQAIEINEWKYREEVMNAMSSLRMELAEKMMKMKSLNNKEKYEKRLSQYTQTKREEKRQKLQKMRTVFNHKLRKLVFARQKINPKYHRMNIIQQFTDKTSELYAPQMRFGEDPRHWSEKINGKCSYWKAFRKLQTLHHTIDDVPRDILPAFDFNKQSKPKSKKKTLCDHTTKWTEESLRRLHEELTYIRKRRYATRKASHLKTKIFVQEIGSQTAAVKGIPDEEEELFQASLFLQKTIKGRAIQAVMFEGRVKCQELIEELKSTHALQSQMEDIKAQMRKKIYGEQRQAEIDEMHERRKNEILCGLEGKTIGDMLDFLSKELLRLQDERKTHALALLADQERHKREAAEAGRRQLEEQRRREHDEMFKQIIKMNQNTVNAYLKNVYGENIVWLAHRKAREYINTVAKKVDETAMETTALSTFLKEDNLREQEIVADLIHNFALPEAEKVIVRKRLLRNQMNYLRVCHDEVYSQIEKVAEGKRSKTGELVPLPKEEHHKIPPTIRVKYLRLKRKRESSSSSQISQVNKTSVLNLHFSEHAQTTSEQTQPNVEKEMWSSGFSRQEVILSDDENSESEL